MESCLKGTWPLVGATVPLPVGRQERPGSTCAIDVEGHKRRPPSKVGGLCRESRVYSLRGSWDSVAGFAGLQPCLQSLLPRAGHPLL